MCYVGSVLLQHVYLGAKVSPWTEVSITSNFEDARMQVLFSTFDGLLINALSVPLPAGLAAATEQLPVVGDSKAQSEAQLLLDACQAAQADTWALPLALILEDVNCLAGASTYTMASCRLLL